ncbi:hypothetical protein EKQ61_03225 [Staphylococcus gallinarum]|uniref:Phage protein n=1 Tax=Staphylococcus gallinarum TaxID=1293 RepID=A0A0D0SGS9_STAGA|nr:hypothetical protein [Staphylococcus gallinarum]KIR11520.1 hypothetical protein SH09_03900 [Staphylococcus gallinarum]RTX81493.1 hypothetical protein EKQ61_03225 [Staphylococcus gallinarum]GEQ05526.1 hypothetical protein SGA02_13540 [Staphylococcus gallinarum]SUM33780.1 Uncharacterised protein [Staphylococcus gallinarum]
MEIGKYYYVVAHEGRMFTGEIITVYGDYKSESILQTSTNVAKALIFDDYNEALETAKEYNLEVKKIRTDILELGSR